MSAPALLWAATIITFATPGIAQNIAREVLSAFPADTQQLTYSNLAQLRGLPHYRLIRLRLVNRQLLGFEKFLRSMGTDPEKDVDEVMLGWRGQMADASELFGLAQGHFWPEKAHEYFTRHRLPSQEYQGLELYASGSAGDPANLFFVFLSSTSAAFGRLNDLKALLDVRAGARPALESNSDFVNWEEELEGSAAQWGVARGIAAVNQAVPWLAAGGKVPGDLNAFASLILAVLYRIDWSSGFSSHLSVLCQDADVAAALAQVVNSMQVPEQREADNAKSGTGLFFQGIEVQANGSRLELSASGSLQVLDQIFR